MSSIWNHHKHTSVHLLAKICIYESTIRYVHDLLDKSITTGCIQLNDAAVYLGLQVLHGLLKGLWWGSLVVTEDGHCPIGPVVRQDLAGEVVIGCAQGTRITAGKAPTLEQKRSDTPAYLV